MINRRIPRAQLIPLLAVGLLAACGGGSSGASAGPTGSVPTAGSGTGSGTASASSAGMPVTATETEFSITLSTRSFTPGTYTFAVDNTGKFPHNLTIAGPGVSQQSSPTMPGGSKGSLTVTLQKGTYELWCSVDGHKDRGMDLKITVV